LVVERDVLRSGLVLKLLDSGTSVEARIEDTSSGETTLVAFFEGADSTPGIVGLGDLRLIGDSARSDHGPDAGNFAGLLLLPFTASLAADVVAAVVRSGLEASTALSPWQIDRLVTRSDSAGAREIVSPDDRATRSAALGVTRLGRLLDPLAGMPRRDTT
jgi:hypothetical protein